MYLLERVRWQRDAVQSTTPTLDDDNKMAEELQTKLIKCNIKSVIFIFDELIIR